MTSQGAARDARFVSYRPAPGTMAVSRGELAALLVFGLLWFANGILKWYPWVGVEPTMESSLQDVFRVVNTIAQFAAVAWLVVHPVARAAAPIPEMTYGAILAASLFLRNDIFLEARSSIPLAHLVFVPLWFGRFWGSSDERRATFLRWASRAYVAVLLCGVAIWIVLPSTADWRGISAGGARSYVFFGQFLGAAGGFLLVNQLVRARGPRQLVLRAASLVLALFLTLISWTRSELAPLALLLLALVGMRPRYAIPVIVLATFVLADNQTVLQTLRLSGDGDISSGRSELARFLWALFVDHPVTGVGRGLAGDLARKNLHDLGLGASVEHGFIMHLAGAGLSGVLYVLVFAFRVGRSGVQVERVRWRGLEKQQRVLLASCAFFAVGSIMIGATGGFAAGSAFTDICNLVVLGFSLESIATLSKSSERQGVSPFFGRNLAPA